MIHSKKELKNTRYIMPKISVLMPVYNTPAKYLREAIDSILGQTYQDFEFLIIDDGSTEKHVKATVDSYWDNRIKYFYKENGDIGDALNYGLRLSKSEFIARMDADDISLPNRLQKQLDFLTSNPDISVVGSWIRFFGDVEFTYEYPSEIGYLDMLSKCRLAHPAVMFRRKDFKKFGFWYNTDVSPAEDYDLWSRAIKVLKMANIPEVLLKYRWHSNNSSNSRSEKQRRVATETQQNMLDFLTKDLNKQKQIKLTLCDDKRWFKIGFPLLSVAVSKTYIGVFIFGCIKIFSKKRLRK